MTASSPGPAEMPQPSCAVGRHRAFRNIQALRALAALLVVLYHLRDWSSIGGFNWNAGQAGVDIFFVLSGFIIGYATDRELNAPFFMLRRLVRIVPIYWMLTIILFAAAHVKPGLVSSGHAPSMQDLTLSLLFIPYASATVPSPIIFLGWTLNFEIFFYVIFALALSFSHRRRVIVAAVIILALVTAGLIFRPDDVVLQTYSNVLMLEFVGGMLASLVLTRVSALPHRLRARLGVTLGAAALVFIFVADALAPDLPRVIRWGLPALALLVGAVMAEQAKMIVTSSLVLIVGDASYALYLSHPFVIKALSVLAGRCDAAVLSIGGIIAIVSFACVLHLFVERPIHQFLLGALLAIRLPTRRGEPRCLAARALSTRFLKGDAA